MKPQLNLAFIPVMALICALLFAVNGWFIGGAIMFVAYLYALFLTVTHREDGYPEAEYVPFLAPRVVGSFLLVTIWQVVLCSILFQFALYLLDQGVLSKLFGLLVAVCALWIFVAFYSCYVTEFNRASKHHVTQKQTLDDCLALKTANEKAAAQGQQVQPVVWPSLPCDCDTYYWVTYPAKLTQVNVPLVYLVSFAVAFLGWYSFENGFVEFVFALVFFASAFAVTRYYTNELNKLPQPTATCEVIKQRGSDVSFWVEVCVQTAFSVVNFIATLGHDAEALMRYSKQSKEFTKLKAQFVPKAQAANKQESAEDAQTKAEAAKQADTDNLDSETKFSSVVGQVPEQAEPVEEEGSVHALLQKTDEQLAEEAKLEQEVTGLVGQVPSAEEQANAPLQTAEDLEGSLIAQVPEQDLEASLAQAQPSEAELAELAQAEEALARQLTPEFTPEASAQDVEFSDSLLAHAPVVEQATEVSETAQVAEVAQVAETAQVAESTDEQAVELVVEETAAPEETTEATAEAEQERKQA